MSLRWFVIVCLFFTAQSAVVKSRNIPVEIVYDRVDPLYYANRNLDAKIQLTSDELLKLKLSDDIINEGKEDVIEAQVDEVVNEPQGNPYGVRNLDAKVQLPAEEIGQAVKFLPNTVENEEVEKEKLEQEENSEQKTKTQDSTEQEVKPAENNAFALLKKAEGVVYFGINSIRNNVDKASENFGNPKLTAETWEKLNQTLEDFFKDQYRRVSLKDDNNVNNSGNNVTNESNFFEVLGQNIQIAIQNFANNFQQNNNQKPPGSEDEQQNQQNAFQNFFNGVGTLIVSGINNMYGQNPQNATSGQEDTGVAQGGGSNFFVDFFTNIQNWVAGGSNQGNNPSQSGNANQSDTGVQPPSNQGPFAFFQGIINNFQPTTSTKAPVQGDEGTVPSSTTQSSIFGGINQAFQNVNAFGSTQAPQGGGGGSSNPFITGAQNVGNQFGQIFGGQNSSNPIVTGIQNAGNQFGQLGGQNSSNPFVTGLQNAGNQFGQLGGQNSSNPFVTGLQNAGNQFGQLGGQNSSNPFVTGLQNAGNQISQLGGQGSTAATEKSKTSNEKDEGVSPLPISMIK